ncbi:MAG: hypothetical protein OJF51_004719 [Nitrospira sp.]|nr:MAG: hypothetical protein OJF51_004719 [Nitrospira sp.]
MALFITDVPRWNGPFTLVEGRVMSDRIGGPLFHERQDPRDTV